MYEEISPQLVLEAVQSLIFRAQARYPNAAGVAVRGVPIGGHMSKAIASSVLAVEELRWCEDRAKQLELGFATPEAHGHESVR
eukprot:s8191_g1.t1